MAKNRKKQRKAKAKGNPSVNRFLRPTEAREAHNDFQSAGAAMRVKPVIESLQGKLTAEQYDNLAYYRDQAHRAEDDMAQGSTLDPERIMGGVSGGSAGSKIPVSVLLATPAICETSRIERDLGQLWEIARAVAVEDMTLSRWCIAQHGGRERYDGKGKLVAVVPVAEKRVMAEALLELKAAANRITRAGY